MRQVAPRTGAPEITIAEEQAEYQPITVAPYRFTDGSSGLLSRWRLSDDERAAIAAGEDLYLFLLTFGTPMQPVQLTVGPPEWTEAP